MISKSYFARFSHLWSPITIFMIFVLTFSPTVINALKCYQNQQNSMLSVTGTSMDCQPNSLTCFKTVDPTMHIAIRSCQAVNCTVSF